jgi:hypothetical protein
VLLGFAEHAQIPAPSSAAATEDGSEKVTFPFRALKSDMTFFFATSVLFVSYKS